METQYVEPIAQSPPHGRAVLAGRMPVSALLRVEEQEWRKHDDDKKKKKKRKKDNGEDVFAIFFFFS